MHSTLRRPRVPSFIGCAVRACLLGGTLATATGCGLAGAMVHDPTGALKAASDKAPLPLVVQRADAANSTALEVNRLLTATPTSVDSPWLAQTALDAKEVSDFEKLEADHPFYEGTPNTILAATVWAALLPKVTSDSGASPSLLAAISPGLEEGYGQIKSKLQRIGHLEGQREIKKSWLARNDLAEADKAALRQQIESADRLIDAEEKLVDPMKDAYVKSCVPLAASVLPAARERYGAAVVNLGKAVDDAMNANTMAVVRYPFVIGGAVTGGLEQVKEDVTLAAKGAISDYVFEHIGRRAKLNSLEVIPRFGQNGIDLTINGLAPADIGQLDVGELVTETIRRTSAFGVKAVMVFVTTNSSAQVLAFERDVLGAIKDGFKNAGWNAPGAAQVAEGNALAINATAVAQHRQGMSRRVVNGIPMP